MRIEVRCEKVGDKYNCIVRGRAGSGRASRRVDGVTLRDVKAVMKALQDDVEGALTLDGAKAL